jgi:hypothetical protein
LLRDRAVSERLAQDARREAHVRFHPTAIATRHVEIYREVLSTRS